ncbi:hypothetical protein LguiB_007539 [Lonicera macranthoides]
MATSLMLFWLFTSVTVIIIQCVAGATESPETIRLDTGGLSRESFPEGFVFGTATSAYQVEGMADKDGRGPSIWDLFIKFPGREPNNATGEVTVDQYHRYKEDVDLMAKLNFDAYRFSISWSRIFPSITPYANLNHYDLPLALQERYNGWLSRDVVKDFADYAEFCFKTFGDRVKNWMTFNEPRCIAALGYDNGYFAPGRCSKAYGNCTAGDSATEPYIVAHNLILCHSSAVERYRENYLAYSYWLYNVPWGLYKAVTYIKEHYGNPTVILAENGMDDPGNITLPKGLHDTTRINYFKGYLAELKKTVDEGANVIGYFAWSLLDNFEWRLGYTSRFGIVYVDFKTLKRYPKMSAYWFKKLLHRNKN